MERTDVSRLRVIRRRRIPSVYFSKEAAKRWGKIHPEKRGKNFTRHVALPLVSRHLTVNPSPSLALSLSRNMAAAYEFDFHVTGADAAATLVAGAPGNEVAVPMDHILITSVRNLQHRIDPRDESVALVPLWQFYQLFESAFRYVADDGHFLTDIASHATTFAHTLTQATAAGFALTNDGPRVWAAPAIFASALGDFAVDRAADADQSPWEFYDCDVVHITNANFTAPHLFLSTLGVIDIRS